MIVGSSLFCQSVEPYKSDTALVLTKYESAKLANFILLSWQTEDRLNKCLKRETACDEALYKAMEVMRIGDEKRNNLQMQLSYTRNVLELTEEEVRLLKKRGKFWHGFGAGALTVFLLFVLVE